MKNKLEKNNILKTGWKSFLLPVILIVLLFTVILVSEIGLISRTTTTVHADMNGHLRTNAQVVENKLEDLYHSIETVARIMAFESGYTQEQMIFAMNALRDECEFDFVVRTNPNGIAFNYLGKENIDLSQRAYFKKAITGTRAIDFVSSGAYDTDNAYVILAVPIMFDDDVVGVFHGSYKSANVASLLSELINQGVDGCDEISIFMDDGALIASSNASFDIEVHKELSKRVQDEALSSDLRYQIKDAQGQERLYFMSQLDVGTGNNCYIVSRMESDYLSDKTSYVVRSSIAMIIVSICIALALLYIVITRQKLTNKIKEHSVTLTAALNAAKNADIAKSLFLSRMSHEIRTPLNAVIGYNTIARNELTEAKTIAEHKQAEMKVMDCLTKSDIASKHLLTIINDVLDMSAIESGKINVVNERFDFKGLISSLTAVFYSQAEAKGVGFDVQFDSHMEEWVIGDQMRVNQVLTNLLSNAVKFTPDGGKVTLLIRPEMEAERILVYFEVQDTGIGMSPEYIERIWFPFEQADSSISRRFGGTGLGLSITKTLVDLMDGKITVESKLGEGSTFSVELSFVRTEQPKEYSFYDFSHINALIVDDDISTCDYIRLLLTRSGVSSTAVNSGADAISAVAAALENKEPYTLCLVDWRMPKMDGIETVRRIREIAGDQLPIIVMTAYDFSDIANRAAEVGVNIFISKPLFQSSLFDLLANISGSHAPQQTDKPSVYDFNGTRVLLAEDNPMNMEIAREILQSAKISVSSAWNGQETVTMFETAPAGTYAAILMDVQMPVMDGYQATKLIRASAHPDAATIPIIAMTADAFAENIAESLSAGMNDHISKPINLPRLFEILRKYIPEI